MNKNILAIIIAAVAVLAAGVLVLNSGNKNNNSTDMADMNMPTSSVSNGSNPMMSEQTNEVISGTATVDMFNFEFTPKKVTIKKGTTVTWNQKDDTRHDVAPTMDYGDAFVPSKLMKKGESYSFTFNTAGTYTYICSPHPYMKGTIEVVE